MRFFEIKTSTPDQTRQTGQAAALCAAPGTLFLLTGDLGSGKTRFVQGFARGMGVPENCPVTSPTYTLINEYAGRMPVYHADLYRIDDFTDADDLGLYEIISGNGVTLIEWAERLDPDLPADCVLRIRISRPISKPIPQPIHQTDACDPAGVYELDDNIRILRFTASDASSQTMLYGIKKQLAAYFK